MHAVSIRSVAKTFDKKRAVIDLSLDVPQGSLFGIIGPNGAGKTTTLRMILNIYAPDTGSITVLGSPVSEEMKSRLGYLPEERGLYLRMQVGDMLTFSAGIKGVPMKKAQAEARRWLEASVAGRQTDARRPPELSTRDNVARAIYTESKEGRGTPHGGAFLDISYLPAERVKRKLPSMYHQFLELADVDITKQAMEVGPTTHYMMGGIRVDPDTAAATVPGLFAAGEAAAGLHGANRLGGNSLSDLLVFGRRAGAAAAAYAKELAANPRIAESEIEAESRALLVPFERASGESPYAVHHALQEAMQSLVGIFRVEADLLRALDALATLRERAEKVKVEGTRMYNPGWHLARDLMNMFTVSEAITRSALLRKESRGAHSRLDYTAAEPAFGAVNHCAVRGADGRMQVGPTPLPRMPAELQALFEPVKEKVG